MRDKFYDHPKLREAFDIYCQRRCAELPTLEEVAYITFPLDFEERMYRIIRRQKHGYYVLFGNVKRQVASVLLMLLAGLTVTTFSVQALREPVVRFITEVFETFTSVLFVNDEPDTSVTEMKTVVPAYIPEGYVVERQTSDGKMMYRVVYYSADTNRRIYYTQNRDDAGALSINTENIEYHTVDVNGLEGLAYIQNNTTSVMFAYGDYTFTVRGALLEEELLQIAASIPLE